MVQAQNLTDMKFDMLDQEDGLSSLWVTDLLQDSSGFIWVGTYEGLNRYDGHQFKVFKHDKKDSLSLLNDNGQKFYLEKNGRLWISYSEGGVSLYDPGKQTFSHYPSPQLKPKQYVDRDFAIRYIDRDQGLWFSGKGLGFRRYDVRSGQTQAYDLPKLDSSDLSAAESAVLNTVFSVYEESPELLWLCTRNGLYSFHLKTKQFTQYPYPHRKGSIRRDYFIELLPDAQRGFWIASYNGGVHYFDRQTRAYRSYSFDLGHVGFYNIINDIQVKNEDELWIASIDQGFGTFHKKTGAFTFIPEQKANDGLFFIDVSHILKTRTGQLFLADENGLLKYDPQAFLFRFQYLPIAESQHGKLFSIRGILSNPQRHLMYFATENGNGLNILDTRSGKLKALPVAIKKGRDSKQRCRGLWQDKQGQVWLLSRDYLYLLDEQRQQLIPMPDPVFPQSGPSEMSYRDFYPDPEGNLWILTFEGGAVKFSTQEQTFTRQVNVPQTLKPLTILQCDSAGTLWMGGRNRLAYLPKQSESVQLLTDIQLDTTVNNSLKGIALDRKGNLWIGVSKMGVLKITPSASGKFQFTWFTEEAGLPYDRIVTMNTDPLGHLWLATVSGVVYMNTETNAFRVMNQGLGMEKSTLGMNFLHGNQGDFYITAPGHWCRADLQALSKKTPSPTMYLDKFRIYNREIAVPQFIQEKLDVQATEQFFSFDFGCIDFGNQSYHRFAYQLIGWDKEWVACGNRRYASYTNLPGGHYTFQVKGTNAEGEWGEPLSVPIFIHTPFYRTGWFLSLLVIGFSAIIYAFYRYRIGEIRKAERLRNEFEQQIAETRMEALRAQMNPHFIFNSLNSINRYIIKNDIKTSSLYLTRFAKLIRMVLENSKHKRISLSDEMEALRIYIELEAFRFEKKFTYSIHINEDVHPDQIEVPPLIIQPYVENAIWHGLLHKDGEGTLQLTLSTDGDMLRIDITDNGIGRVKAMEFKSANAPTRKSVGLKLTEERIHIHNQDADTAYAPHIIDRYDEQGLACGTTVILKIPL